MKRAVLIAALLFGPSLVTAQTDPSGTDITTRKLQTSRGYRLPVAIEELELGAGSTTPDRLERVRELTEVIRQDLAFSGYFKLVRFDSLYLKLMGVSTLDSKGWSHLGAEYLGTGRVTPTSEGFRVQIKLEGTVSREVIFDKSFVARWEQWRSTGHQIAGEIIYYLWGGRTKIFDTHIVTTWEAENGKNLYMLDYDGYNARALTNFGEINISPCWFPSGDRLVFTSYRDSNPDLWLLLLQNNSVQKISGRQGLNTAPAVSPDGRLIAATLSIDDNAEIYLMSESGQSIRRLTNHPGIDSEPSFSPDGTRIAFTSDRLGSPQVFVMNSDGSNVRRLTFQGSYNASPAWSPRGDRIAYVSRTDNGGFDICTIDTEGGSLLRVTTQGVNENPDWSPDGYHLVFSSLRRGQQNLFTATYDGSNERQITSGGGFSNPVWGPFPRP